MSLAPRCLFSIDVLSMTLSLTQANVLSVTPLPLVVSYIMPYKPTPAHSFCMFRVSTSSSSLYFSNLLYLHCAVARSYGLFGYRPYPFVSLRCNSIQTTVLPDKPVVVRLRQTNVLSPPLNQVHWCRYTNLMVRVADLINCPPQEKIGQRMGLSRCDPHRS